MSLSPLRLDNPQTQLDNILEQGKLSDLFQPIISLNRQEIYGYEGLIRGPSDSPLHTPAHLLATAQRYGRHHELDTYAVKP